MAGRVVSNVTKGSVAFFTVLANSLGEVFFQTSTRDDVLTFGISWNKISPLFEKSGVDILATIVRFIATRMSTP